MEKTKTKFWSGFFAGLLVAVIIFPLAWTQFKLSRLEGLFLVLIYLAYIYNLYLQLPAQV